MWTKYYTDAHINKANNWLSTNTSHKIFVKTSLEDLQSTNLLFAAAFWFGRELAKLLFRPHPRKWFPLYAADGNVSAHCHENPDLFADALCLILSEMAFEV